MKTLPYSNRNMATIDFCVSMKCLNRFKQSFSSLQKCFFWRVAERGCKVKLLVARKHFFGTGMFVCVQGEDRILVFWKNILMNERNPKFLCVCVCASGSYGFCSRRFFFWLVCQWISQHHHYHPLSYCHGRIY